MREKMKQEIMDSRLSKLFEEFLDEFDSDRNGTIDIIDEENEFDKLIQKNQKIIIEKEKEFGQSYLHQFVRFCRIKLKPNDFCHF